MLFIHIQKQNKKEKRKKEGKQKTTNLDFLYSLELMEGLGFCHQFTAHLKAPHSPPVAVGYNFRISRKNDAYTFYWSQSVKVVELKLSQ